LQGNCFSATARGMLLVILLLTGCGLWLFNVWRANTEAMSDELLRFDRLRSVASYSQVIARLSPEAEDKVYDDLFLIGKTEAVVSADLLTQLKQMAATRGVEVVRAGDVQSKTEGPITLVGESLEMSGGITDIFSFVQDIEEGKPLLFLDRLNLRTNGFLGDEVKNDTLLIVEMQVFGAVRSRHLQQNATASH
jgi:hypothetical protein